LLIYIFYALNNIQNNNKIKADILGAQAWHCQCGKIITNRWEQGGNRKKGNDKVNGD